MNFYAFTIKNDKGKEVNLKDYEGKVVLVVNTATECGFTPQYEDLQRLYKAYHEKGLEIIDIPCNQFGGQAPGTGEEIAKFCSLNYATEFDHMEKSDVNGENELPLYKFLKGEKTFKGFDPGKMADILDGILSEMDPNYKNNSDIKWNFTKFLIDRKGNVVERFEPTKDMAVVEEEIKKLI